MDGQSAGSIAAAIVGSRAADCAVVDEVSPTADCVGALETGLLDGFSPAGTVKHAWIQLDTHYECVCVLYINIYIISNIISNRSAIVIMYNNKVDSLAADCAAIDEVDVSPADCVAGTLGAGNADDKCSPAGTVKHAWIQFRHPL